MKKKLEKNNMIQIFQELMLYYPNNFYKDYNDKEITTIISMYYDVLQDYEEKYIRRRMIKYISKEKFFPQACDLIPQESDFRENL